MREQGRPGEVHFAANRQVHFMTPATPPLRRRARDEKGVRLVSLLGTEPGTLQTQLFRRLRQLIVNGTLRPGTRLPSSRAMARDLGLSRNTVIVALEQLVADGWAVARKGSGTFVRVESEGSGYKSTSSDRRIADSPDPHPFMVGVPALDLFPLETWSRLQARRWRTMPRAGLSEGEPLGWPALRQAIADHLSVARGMVCEPQQVIVTNGARQGYDLLAQCLGGVGATAVTEDPCYFGLRDALRSNGLQVVPVPVDEEGIALDSAPAEADDAAIIFLTPQCQFPTGVELSARRAERLFAWAGERGAWLVEDGYDSEFVLEGESPRPLNCRPGGESAIYLNSFNKVLFPGLRIGFIVAPPRLVDQVSEARRLLGPQTNVPNQMVLTDFIEDGHLDTHIRRCREAYAERQAVLRSQIAERLGSLLAVEPRRRGLHLVAQLNGTIRASALTAAAARRSVEIVPLTEFTDRDIGERYVLLGFAGFGTAALRQAAAALAEVVRDSGLMRID
jgi:GntR family transcriptional regulator / MocR family aminotransferase